MSTGACARALVQGLPPQRRPKPTRNPRRVPLACAARSASQWQPSRRPNWMDPTAERTGLRPNANSASHPSMAEAQAVPPMRRRPGMTIVDGQHVEQSCRTSTPLCQPLGWQQAALSGQPARFPVSDSQCNYCHCSTTQRPSFSAEQRNAVRNRCASAFNPLDAPKAARISKTNLFCCLLLAFIVSSFVHRFL